MSNAARKPNSKGAEEARKQLPALVVAAMAGRTTLITRHGKAVAAIVPADRVAIPRQQASLTALSGSGKGMWGKNSGRMIAKLRDEWSR